MGSAGSLRERTLACLLPSCFRPRSLHAMGSLSSITMLKIPGRVLGSGRKRTFRELAQCTCARLSQQWQSWLEHRAFFMRALNNLRLPGRQIEVLKGTASSRCETGNMNTETTPPLWCLEPWGAWFLLGHLYGPFSFTHSYLSPCAFLLPVPRAFLV